MYYSSSTGCSKASASGGYAVSLRDSTTTHNPARTSAVRGCRDRDCVRGGETQGEVDVKAAAAALSVLRMTLSITAASVVARDLVTPRQIDGRACGRPRPVRSGQARATIISPAWALNRRLVAGRRQTHVSIPCRLISQALAAAAAAAAAVADDDDDDNFSEELRRRRRQRRTVVQVQRQFPVTPLPHPPAAQRDDQVTRLR